MPLDLSLLNPAQKKAVEEIKGPCMIIAGAGSGKTRVLTYKIAHLIESGISPFEILALTFTNKAANEMKERISELVKGNSEKIWMGTFHSMCARILRIEADKIGFTRNYTIYDTEDSVHLIKQIMTDSGISTENTNPKGIHSAINKLKNKLILPLEFSNLIKTPFDKIINSVYDDYQNSLLKNNCMDFDDLLIKPIELFKRYPDVLEKYQARFKFILVDEYQDTNKAQYILIKLLADKFKNVSIVGDDAQSIYKWRGAEIQNIFDFEDDFKECKVFRLEQNYRSTKNILNLADDVIKKNRKQITKNLWTNNSDGELIHLIETMTDKDESYRIARYISEEIQKKKLNFKDFVVLYRTNAQSRTLEESLRHNGIPYIIVGGVRFYQRKEIKDILSHFKIIVNPNDNESMIRVLGLKGGIGKSTIERLLTLAGKEDKQLFDILKNIKDCEEFSNRIKNLLVEVLNLIYKYQYLKDEINLSEAVRGIIDEMGILRTLRLENTIEANERMNNIEELISAVAEYSDSTDEPSLEIFLQQISLVADIDEVDNQKNAVTLMTIHSAKGLEFPVVFITGLEEGLFPVSGSMTSEEEMEEERRLFYVAITRAKQKLYMLFANQRYRFGIQSYQMKSRFLREISEDILNSNITIEGLKFNENKQSTKKKKNRDSKAKAIRYEFYDRKSFDKEHIESNDKFPDIKKGVTVNHNTFGKGTVISTSGRGLDKRAEIYFEDVGLKKIVLKYAKMRVDD
ncbi:MAG: UvrD-helicase domain-containing protein [Ignavibacteria bacterium]|nr:UvrD-helicase domain-containing protein [Ignavibacteria bacterium]